MKPITCLLILRLAEPLGGVTPLASGGLGMQLPAIPAQHGIGHGNIPCPRRAFCIVSREPAENLPVDAERLCNGVHRGRSISNHAPEANRSSSEVLHEQDRFPRTADAAPKEGWEQQRIVDGLRGAGGRVRHQASWIEVVREGLEAQCARLKRQLSCHRRETLPTNTT